MEEVTTYYEILRNRLEENFWDDFDYRYTNNVSMVLLMEVVRDLLYELHEKAMEGRQNEM